MLIKSKNELDKIESFLNENTEQGIIVILACEKSKDLCKPLFDHLKEKNQKFIGGYFPQIIHDFISHEKGLVISKIKTTKKPILFKNIGSESLEQEIQERIYKDVLPHQTCLTWLDGLSPNIHNFLTHLYSSLGPNLQYIGGGAGSLSLKQEPCIFTEEGIFENAAVLLLIDKTWSLEVKHGWEPISNEVVATEVNGNTIIKINWEPALKVYESIIGDYQDHSLNQENFFSISKNFPFGLCKESDEYVVRDPIIMNEDQSITCVGNVPKGSKMQILTANKKKLIEAASTASSKALKEITHSSQSLIIDCISRTIYLDKDFQQELLSAKKHFDLKQKSLNFGALTLGEIASSSNGILEFYNKSFVIGVSNG